MSTESERIKSEISARIRQNASKIQDNVRFDILTAIADHSIFHVNYKIVHYLDYLDIYSCSTVSKSWNAVVHEILDGSKILEKGWSNRSPRIKVIQCEKKRAVCTVSKVVSDEDSIFCGIGTPGNIELWNRRPTPSKRWIVRFAHDDGVYSLSMNRKHCFSGGGNDGIVKVWDRDTGLPMQCLTGHDYIVWNILLKPDGTLFTASYDCTMCSYTLSGDYQWELKKTITGTLSWADAAACDGDILITQDGQDFTLSVWSLNWSYTDDPESQPAALLNELVGHSGDVNDAVLFKRQFILSGGSDATLRLWDFDTGECLKVFTGMEGKIWCLDMNRSIIVAGGRFGQIGVWNWNDGNDSGEGRILCPHSRTTAVGTIKLEKIGLISGDGEGHIFELDFWNTFK